MKFEGGCYCGELRYEAEGEPLAKAQCHCRQCQYFSGGHPNVLLCVINLVILQRGSNRDRRKGERSDQGLFLRANEQHTTAQRSFAQTPNRTL